jgi:transposase-like protein
VPDDFPKTAMEFDERFATEEACRAYLIRLRWPDGFRCPTCGHTVGWVMERNLMLCARCRHQTSITAGTIMHKTRKPLRMWFKAMWWIATQKTGGSAKGLQRILGLRSEQTAWAWLHKLRRAMVRLEREKLSGVVEVDDSYLGGVEEGVHGRETESKARLVVAAEEDGNGIGRIRLRHVLDVSADSLIPFVQDTVVVGSVVHTDGWPGYASLGERGYVHRVTVIGSDRRKATELLPRVHRVVSLLKRWLMGTHQGAVRHKHLQHYLEEFTFRFNRRTSRHVGKIFYRLAQQAVHTAHTPYWQLVARVAPDHPLDQDSG